MRAQCARLGRFLRRRPSERRLNWCATWPAREKSAPTVDRLLPLMRSGSPLLRWECVWALGEIGDHRAVEPLIEALEDTDSSVSEGAALALSKLGSLAVDRLIEALPSADPEVRLAVVWVLGVVRDQRAAATALGRLRAPSAVPLLVDLLRDQDEEVRGAAANALGLVADARAIGPLLELMRSGGEAATEAALAVAAMGPPAVAPLMALLTDPDDDVGDAAAGALAAICEPAAEPLLALMRDTEGDDRARWRAAWALSMMGPAVVDALMALLGHEAPCVRGRAVRALSGAGVPRALDAVLPLLGDQDERVRCSAAASIGRMGCSRGVAPLLAALPEATGDFRAAVVAALGHLDDRQIAGRLRPLLVDAEEPVREAAREALAAITNRRPRRGGR